MSIKFRPNPNFRRELAADADTKRALAANAEVVAKRAETFGRQVADSYKTDVVIDGDGVHLVASTDHDGVDAAGWIEFGTGEPAPTPAYAPLRKAVQAEGMELG